MRPLLLLSALVLLAPPRAPLQVTASGGRVTIRATAVPLSEVLQELARITGMKVVYESGLPGHPITTTIENLPEEEAIAKLLDGVALSWGVKLSAHRRRVELLVLANPSAIASPRVPAAASYPASPRPTPTPTPSAKPTSRPVSEPPARPRSTPTARPTPTPSPRS